MPKQPLIVGNPVLVVVDMEESGDMPVEEFQNAYMNRVKTEGYLDAPLFQVLDDLFHEVDSYTNDPRLLAHAPDFYLDEARLREKVRQAAKRLASLKH